MSKCGLSRETTDKFYTNADVVTFCLALWNQILDITPTSLIIEPSAGNGAFTIPLSKTYKNVISYDILPENPVIVKQNYLELQNPISLDPIHIIGNPPFRRQSSLAKSFIKKSAEFATTISFILPKSFKKDSFMKTFPLNYHLLSSTDLPKNSFNINGNIYDVPCVFQIWKKKEELRVILNTPKISKYVTYVKKMKTQNCQ